MTSPKPLSIFEILFTITQENNENYTLENPKVGILQWPKKLLPNNIKKGDRIKLGPLDSNIIKTQINSLLFN